MPNNPEVKVSRLADADLDAIWSYLAANNPDAAEKFMLDLAQRLRLLAANPSLGRQHAEIIVGIRSFPHKKYVIFYFPLENGIEVFRIIHSARDLETLFSEFFRNLE